MALNGIKNSYGEPPAPVAISVVTDNEAYLPRDTIKISGFVHDEKGNPVVNFPIDIMVLPSDNKSRVIYKTAVLTDINGSFYDHGLRIGEDNDVFGTILTFLSSDEHSDLYGSKYILNATGFINGTSTSSWTQIEIKNGFVTFYSIVLYMGLAYFAGLIFTLWIPLKIPSYKGGIHVKSFRPRIGLLTKKIFVFIFITGIVLSPVEAFLLLDLEIKNSPIGVIKKQIVNEKGHIEVKWLLNIGGAEGDNYTAGIQVPIYVIVFGIAGGYLRYLYDIWNREKVKKKKGLNKPVSRDNSTVSLEEYYDRLNRRIFRKSLGDLALIFMSPLVAIAIWFVLFQNGATSDYVLAAVSVTVGLLMREIIIKLEEFSGSLVKTNKERPLNNQK